MPAERLLAVLENGEPTSPALVAPGDERPVTRRELAESVETLAGRLAAAGVRRGDRVSLSLPNGPEFVELLLAITALGAAAAPLNPMYTEEEFRTYLDDIDPRLLLLPEDRIRSARAAARQPVADVRTDGTGPPAILVNGRETEEEKGWAEGAADDVALILHTSGTTSRPKQVPLLQQNVMASARTIAAHYQLGPSDVAFCVMPLFHIHGLVASTLASLASGGSVVVPRRFVPTQFWPQARAADITWVSAGPTLHQMILDRFDDHGVLTTLRFTRSCSSALSAELFERAENTYGAPMLEAYGMTEASHQMTSNPLPPASRLVGSVGVATGTEIGVIDRDRRFLPDGASGEVVVRGPSVTPGYLHNPEANAESFFDGWFRTGDLGVLESGYLRLVGRIKEMILRGGENISPAEIESALLSHPAVADAVSFGVNDEKYGETVAAAVTLRADATTDAVALIAHCRSRLAAFKVPETIHVVSEIPRTATGKVQRRRVAEWIATRQ